MGGQQSTSAPARVPAPGQGETVLIPVDASKQSEAAFLWYARHLHKQGNTVKILHCQELIPTSPILMEHAFQTKSYADMLNKAQEEGKKIVSQYEKKLEEQNIPGSVTMEMGRAGEVVIGAAEKSGVHHIVMGTRGYGMVRRTILGSVSEYVVHHSAVPVTVVPKETQSWFF